MASKKSRVLARPTPARLNGASKAASKKNINLTLDIDKLTVGDILQINEGSLTGEQFVKMIAPAVSPPLESLPASALRVAIVKLREQIAELFSADNLGN